MNEKEKVKVKVKYLVLFDGWMKDVRSKWMNRWMIRYVGIYIARIDIC